MPPRPGDIVELDITTLAYGGQGVARLDEFVVFVRGAVPGDRVRAKVTRRKKSHAEARVIELLTPSPRRIAPVCEHTDDCGGCEWQTLAYEAQLEFKQQQVVESLQRLGHLEGYELEPIRGMDDPWRYRNKMEFSFGEAEDGELLLGLHRRGSWREIVETTDCRLASARINRARQAVADAARALGLRPYGRDHHHGLLRHLVVREGLSSGDLLLNLFVSARFPEEPELVARVAADCDCTSFGITVNDTPADAAVGDGPHMLLGPPLPPRAPRRRRAARAGRGLPADQQRHVRDALRHGAGFRRPRPRRGRPSTCTAASARSASLWLAARDGCRPWRSRRRPSWRPARTRP